MVIYCSEMENLYTSLFKDLKNNDQISSNEHLNTQPVDS